MSEGPFSISDLCDCGEGELCELANDPTQVLVVKCTLEGSEEMFDEELFFEDFNAAYKAKGLIMNSAGPYVIGETYEN